MPPTQSPLRLDAEILSLMRSEVTSRSNWANDSSTFRVSRPIEVVVLNCWVTETNDTLCSSNSSTSLAKSAGWTLLRAKYDDGGFSRRPHRPAGPAAAPRGRAVRRDRRDRRLQGRSPDPLVGGKKAARRAIR